MTSAYVELKNISKTYRNNKEVLTDVTISIKQGEFIAVVGPSGSGKTTLLDIICGFEQSDHGQVLIAGQQVDQLTPKERDVAMVFQHYALLPHMTAYENLAFGLNIRKVKKAEISAKVNWVADLLELTESLAKYPRELSGGQQQRVALGRAIVREPKLFLMDEPLSNLDASLREQTSREIVKLHQELKATVIYVTHAQDEAMTMADRILVLKAGRIHQIGTPREIYEKPNDLFVARFIGKPAINLIQGSFQKGYFVVAEQPIGELSYLKEAEGSSVIVGIRSEDLRLTATGGHRQVVVSRISYLGQESLYYVKDDREIEFVVREKGPPIFEVGAKVDLIIEFNKALLFDPITEKRIGEV